MLLNATGVPVYVILPAYGILFLLAVPLLRRLHLWMLAAVVGVGAPWLLPLADRALVAAGPSAAISFCCWAGTIPSSCGRPS
jgi:hypothetical protein